MVLKEHKKKAWIATALLLTVLFIWALVAVHDSAVAAARQARANKTSNSPAACPFSKVPSTQTDEPKGCCHSKTTEGETIKPEEVKKSLEKLSPSSSKNFEKYANLNDEELEEFMKQFTPEQLAKCPHLKARKTNKKK
jgi:hypothetical protein